VAQADTTSNFGRAATIMVNESRRRRAFRSGTVNGFFANAQGSIVRFAGLWP
jgi:hypothetical protein